MMHVLFSPHQGWGLRAQGLAECTCVEPAGSCCPCLTILSPTSLERPLLCGCTTIAQIAAKLGRLRGVRDMPVYSLVEAEVAGFLDSLPLMRELKSEALRTRHWRALMAATGQEFDMDPRTFTLANMFAMQLHRVGGEHGWGVLLNAG